MPSPLRLLTPVVMAVLFALPAGTAAADPTCTPVPPTCLSPTPGATPSPTPSATPILSPTPSPTHSPTPRPTHRASRSPRPRSTFSTTPGSTESPVTATIGVGGVQPGSTSPVPVAKQSTGHRSHTGDTITLLIELVLGGAVLLGFGGATGLYLTRHPHEH